MREEGVRNEGEREEGVRNEGEREEGMRERGGGSERGREEQTKGRWRNSSSKRIVPRRKSYPGAATAYTFP